MTLRPQQHLRFTLKVSCPRCGVQRSQEYTFRGPYSNVQLLACRNEQCMALFVTRAIWRTDPERKDVEVQEVFPDHNLDSARAMGYDR